MNDLGTKGWKTMSPEHETPAQWANLCETLRKKISMHAVVILKTNLATEPARTIKAREAVPEGDDLTIQTAETARETKPTLKPSGDTKPMPKPSVERAEAKGLPLCGFDAKRKKGCAKGRNCEYYHD